MLELMLEKVIKPHDMEEMRSVTLWIALLLALWLKLCSSSQDLELHLKCFHIPNLGPCICDLTANGCDVNCCCDEDCTDEDRATFSECLDQKFIVDDLLCLQNSVVFRNNSPDYVQVADPSLFCVRRDNCKISYNFTTYL
ncbi:putative tectonic-1 [Apostichopus japonicus]|uniref:Putative tectonic-1 n=1 Tax=Stichopus japonicus TaxID=307972 RepID=A0A2G8JEB6_STIJA|nr:putative tectonic-1 [Apostichopus japonicus]